MAKLNFGGVEENVVTREEFPLSKAQEVLKDEVIAIIGYGVQGPAQALNLRDNGINVIVGQAPEFKEDWDKAVNDGFVPGETLFPIEEAAEKATVIQYLVSDAAQRTVWPVLEPCLKEGDALYFSHGFSVTYKEQTGVIPPANVDVILVAPRDREPVSGEISWQEQGSIPAMQFSRITQAVPKNEPLPLVSVSVRVTFFQLLLKMKYTATLPENVAFLWVPWPGSWKHSTRC